MLSRNVTALFAGALVGLLAACAGPSGPGPGGVPETAAFRDPGDAKLGQDAHPKILAQFGGAYDDARLAPYVARIGREIAAVSEQPDAPWTFTVLDTPAINAFALPGGYVYVTRGLVALAESEAELAGVIGHEIGHVTAGHSGLRRDRAEIAGLGVLLGGIGLAVLGVDPSLARGAMQVGQTAARGALASYSRADELAADNLGIRYLARAGYDPYAQADFLDRMGEAAALEASIAGESYDRDAVGFLASHPATGPRTREAIAVAEAAGAVGTTGADRRRDAFLGVIDGMLYGDNPAQGVVEGQRFIHPGLRFAFEAPAGFRIVNMPRAVVAVAGDGSRLILDGVQDPGGDLGRYIPGVWVPALARQARLGPLRGPGARRVNGLEAAIAALPAEIDGTRMDLLLAVIRHRGALYRFTGIARPGGGAVNQMAGSVATFRDVPEAEAQRHPARRIEIAQVKAGDSVASLARRMAGEPRAEARFRLLNGLGAGDTLKPGRKVKLIR